MDISDAIFVLTFLFLDPSREPGCMDAADVDDSGRLDITDPIAMLQHLFTDGLPPPAPGPDDCGVDPTDDAFGCDTSPGCA